MEVILTQDIKKLGEFGKVVKVKNGYARNFLVPKGLAVFANKTNKTALEHQLKVINAQKEKLTAQAKELAAKIEKVSVTVAKQVGQDEKIFGSVTTAELQQLVAAEGIEIDKKDIVILEEIKKVGVYNAEVKLPAQVTAKFKVWVVAQ